MKLFGGVWPKRMRNTDLKDFLLIMTAMKGWNTCTLHQRIVRLLEHMSTDYYTVVDKYIGYYILVTMVIYSYFECKTREDLQASVRIIHGYETSKYQA